MYPTMYFPVPESEDNSHNIYMDDTLLQSHDKYAEFDSIKKWKPFTIMEPVNIEFETEIFISKERLLNGEYLDLSIVYTPYRSMFFILIYLYIYISNVTNIYKLQTIWFGNSFR